MTEPVTIGDCTLYLGDCLDILPTLGKVDAVVTDPPYPSREDLFATDTVWPVLRSLIPSIPSFVFWPCTPDYPCGEPDAVHIWHKAVPIHPRSEIGNVAGHHYERILSYGLGRKSEVLRVAAIMPKFAACQAECVNHPTQKPIALMESLLKRTHGAILDPFMGSGTTGVACAKLGRKFIGIELDDGYFDIACERIQKAYDQPDLFVPAPAKPKQEAML